MVRHTETALGPVDILVNNAGIMYYEHIKNCQFDEWDTQVDINCKVRGEERDVLRFLSPSNQSTEHSPFLWTRIH
jgi:NADP-dependent 3-hydroxy acid dehydrogenase YdfG